MTDPAERDQAWGASYLALTEKIVAAKRVVSEGTRHPASLPEQRAEHRLLTSLLDEAVTFAFAAEAAGAARPPGTPPWVAEGLARSTEREAAVFAALEVG